MSERTGVRTNRVMVDIETLGLKRGAAIVSIGAVEFGPAHTGDTFYRSIDRESCKAAGLTVDEDTLEWWQDQDDDAKAVLDGGQPLSDVLAAFRTWYVGKGFDEVWANSPSFDCELLEVAYDAVGIGEPWDFHDERDFRTLKSLPCAVELEQNGTEHDALDDARYQARIAAQTLAKLEADYAE